MTLPQMVEAGDREYLWTINTSGPIAEVIEHVSNATLPQCIKQVPELYEKKAQGGVMTQGGVRFVEVEVEPSEEDVRDFARAKRAILAELEDVKTPFAGVTAHYVENPSHLGGYTMRISVSAYDRQG